MLTEEAQITADKDAILRDLRFMTARWHEIGQPAKIELRAFAEDKQPQWAQFSLDWMDEAADWALSMNQRGRNVYVVRNPVRDDVNGSAKDTDILGSFFLWADCDEPASTENVRRFDGPRWTASVVTGTIPHQRVHVYWELEDFCQNLDAWRETQVAISRHFASDGVVVNPSRIMRLGGTVVYPDSKKQAKGYISEISTIRTEWKEERAPVDMMQMRRVFATSTPAKPASDFAIDTGPQPLDRERMAIQALEGKEWHNAVIRLVGSYVSKGLSDTEIHSLTDPLTLPGYTVEQTRREVQTAIDGARRKGWTPETYATPQDVDWDTPAEKPDMSAQLEWFDTIQPVLSDAYLVKGILGDGAMSVVYGPSNSGKTFFALDIAFHIAIGGPWRGRRCNPAAVLYLAAEGGRGVANRVAALRSETGVSDVPFALRRAGMDLLKDKADLQTVYDLAQEVRQRNPRLLIVIDTLSRVMAGGDENSPADMTALIRNIDAIREATGAHIMLIHHSGKDAARGARGHSSLRAATDTEIEVQNEDGNRAAMVTKQRDYEGGQVFAFGLKSVPLGHDQDGDEVTSCIVTEEDSEEYVAAKKATKGRGKNQLLIMETFDQMCAEGLGRGNPGGVGCAEPGKFWAVNADELRRISQGKMVGKEPGRLFRQAWDALTGPDGLFVVADNLAWRIDRRKQ